MILIPSFALDRCAHTPYTMVSYLHPAGCPPLQLAPAHHSEPVSCYNLLAVHGRLQLVDIHLGSGLGQRELHTHWTKPEGFIARIHCTAPPTHVDLHRDEDLIW